MLSSKIKDYRLRKALKKNELKQTYLKFITINSLNKKSLFCKYLPNHPSLKAKNFSSIKLVRRCVLSNRSRGSIRPFNISRIKLRELMQFGIVPGYRKSVW